jgi:hypothetical protein
MFSSRATNSAVVTRLVRNCAQGRVTQYAGCLGSIADFSGILGPPPEPVIGRRVRADPVAGDDDCMLGSND